MCGKTMDNSVILVTVLMGATVFPHFSVGLVSVFLHFTEIYRTYIQAFANETTISWSKNFQKSPFFVVLLLKIAVFMNNFGENRPDSTKIRQLMTHLLYDALLYLTHCRFHGNIYITHMVFCAKYT